MIPAVVVPTGTAGGEYERAAKSLLCDCGCSPQAIKDCACMRAEDLRVSIAQDAASGKTADQIIAAYVARSGTKVLIAPPASGFNLIAWIGPTVGLVVAAAALVAMIARWKRTSVAPAPAAPRTAASEADLARLAREMDELR